MLRAESDVLGKPLEAALRGVRDCTSYNVNGQPHDLKVGNQPGEVNPSHPLVHTLGETPGLTGTKVGCDHAWLRSFQSRNGGTTKTLVKRAILS